MGAASGVAREAVQSGWTPLGDEGCGDGVAVTVTVRGAGEVALTEVVRIAALADDDGLGVGNA
ncbi:MAG: hypothetical protein ACRCWS_03400 [Propionibacteriaceae bacterium]